MARKSISDLKVGDKVRLKFHGSKSNGNDPYEAEYTFIGFDWDKSRLAVFGDDKGQSEFEAYFFRNRWRYGTSSEMLTVQEML